jgi:restriction endonuclease S subunit
LKLGSDAVKPGPKTKTKLSPGNDKSDPALVAVLEKLETSVGGLGAKITLVKVEDGVAEFKFTGKAVGFMYYNLRKKEVEDGELFHNGVSVSLFALTSEVNDLTAKISDVKEELEQLRTTKEILRPLAFHFQPKLVKTLDQLHFAL